MASKRDVFLRACVDRIAGIEGFAATLRGTEAQFSGNAVTAVVFQDGEDKTIATIDQYDATLRVQVLVFVRTEDADAVEDGGNPYRYLDRMVSLVEAVMHTPDSWGISPGVERVEVTGHEVSDPSEDNELHALVYLTFRYRHHYQDTGA